MKQDGKLLGYYNYTVILTYIGMITGFVGIIAAFEGNSLNSIICLMISGVCDMFDGAIASTNKKRTSCEKCFGIQIDSLSDLICFGVLPAVIVYSLSSHSRFTVAVCALYVLCGLIRLAYFNVDEQERQKDSTSHREIYYGLPVTLAAMIVPIMYALINLMSIKPSSVLVATLMIMAVLFILPFKIKKPKIIGKICVVICGMAEILLIMIV